MGSQPAQPLLPASRKRRVFYALSGIGVVMVVGIVGFHQLEGMDWVNAIYFESMLATGQGPPITLTTDAGKLFASVMGFVSISAVFTSLIITLVPIISQLWREGLEKVERDAKVFGADISKKEADDKQASAAREPT